jgi:hypothetical protein
VGEPIWARLGGRIPNVFDTGTLLFTALASCGFLFLTLGLHGGQRWARPLMVVAVIFWAVFSIGQAKFSVVYPTGSGPAAWMDAPTNWPAVLQRVLPNFAIAAWVVWYLYGRRRTREYYRALKYVARTPTI